MFEGLSFRQMAEENINFPLDGDGGGYNGSGNSNSSDSSTLEPTSTSTSTDTVDANSTSAGSSFHDAVLAEEAHEFDAWSALALNVTLIACIILAYNVKRFRIYSLPESAGALLIGVVIGGIARLTTNDLELFQFSPEVFFFVLLPPIIFEAGYSLDQKGFFDNLGAIVLYAMLGTLISTFVVGLLCFYSAKAGLIRDIDQENPMESLLFGALISAVDPVATISIMGSAELNCDPLLFSLVFGESVLNDAIAIVLFKTFFKYYDPEGPDWKGSEVPSALLSFVTMSGLSVLVGVFLGLTVSWVYKHTQLSDYPNLETSLLFSFCYLCYATAEAVGLSGIMALFFQGIVLAHYNSYNLSPTAHVASEQIFSTLATITETVVFVYMGMGVFTGRFENWDIQFSVLALVFCLVGRFFNIFPLSWIANQCRRNSSTNSKIPIQMQCVLWFAGLRGAIAFALSENMPGPNKEVYATATLSICIFTTVVCGGFTEPMLTLFGMKEDVRPGVLSMALSNDDDGAQDWNLTSITYQPPSPERRRMASLYPEIAARRVHDGAKGLWKRLDDEFLIPHFGGPTPQTERIERNGDHLGNYELGSMQNSDDEASNSDSGSDEFRDNGGTGTGAGAGSPSGPGTAKDDKWINEETTHSRNACE